ncbi:hypothetical protein NA57DRAFT_72211 [Rhizodiscina lignyota]|uniref:Uncharacterized protein n=1 Tax=Rhizodiscina lignyota TaxID=1504668 RepID=A0A9P4IRL6_9PEZI|nr:hypothetical protein NA57DRAFT_72211 [Rhizodiscina lignyota]
MEPFVQVLSSTPALESMVDETAHLLKDKVMQRTEQQEMWLFKYKLTEECATSLRKLAEELIKANGKEIKLMLETRTDGKTWKRKPGEKPTVFSHEKGRAHIEANQIAILMLIQTRDSAVKAPKLCVWDTVIRNDNSNEIETPFGSPVLMGGPHWFETIPSAIPYMAILLHPGEETGAAT